MVSDSLYVRVCIWVVILFSLPLTMPAHGAGSSLLMWVIRKLYQVTIIRNMLYENYTKKTTTPKKQST